MPVPPTRRIKIFRYAVFFDGVDDYAIISHSPVLDVQPRNKITIEIYVYLFGSQPGFGIGVIIDKRTEGTANYDLGFNQSSMYMDMRIHAGGTTYAISVPYKLLTWNHYVMVLNGSWLGGYLNGELHAQRSDILETTGNTTPLRIGKSVYGMFRVGMYLHSVRIYTEPLTAREILHNYQYPDNPVRNGLVLWLHAHPDYIGDIDDDGVLEWVDLSGNGNHAKLYGATLATLIKSPLR